MNDSWLISGRILSELAVAVQELDALVENQGVTFTGVVTVYNLEGEPVRFNVEYDEEDDTGVHYARLTL